MKNPWKISTFVLAALLIIVMSFPLVQSSHAERQPLMRNALKHLKAAKANLKRATHDKGGHRVKALAAVNKAIKHVKKGIKHDNKK